MDGDMAGDSAFQSDNAAAAKLAVEQPGVFRKRGEIRRRD